MRFQTKVKALFLLICMISLMFAGCDYKDIDRRLFIIAIGIDRANDSNKIRLTLKAVLPPKQQGQGLLGEGESELYTAEATSMGRAIRMIKTQVSYEPDFSHMKIVIFGKEFAKKHNISKYIDYVMRRRDVQDIAWSAIGDTSARAILKIKPKGEAIAGNNLFMKFGQGVNSEYVIPVKIFEMYSDLVTPGFCPISPIIEKGKGGYVINKVGVFKKGKLKLVLQPDKTRLLNILVRGVNRGFISFMSKKPKEIIGIGVRKGSARNKIVRVGDKLLCEIKVKMDCALEETSTETNNLNAIAVMASKVIKKDIESLIHLLQRKKVDPLKLQADYYGRNASYKLTNKWLDKMFPGIKFNVNAKVKIQSSGSLR